MYDVAVPSPITQRFSVDSVEHTTCLNVFDIFYKMFMGLCVYKQDRHNMV